MRAKIRKINGVFPVTVAGAVYIEGTNKTVKDKLAELDNINIRELDNKFNIRDPELNEVFEVEE